MACYRGAGDPRLNWDPNLQTGNCIVIHICTHDRIVQLCPKWQQQASPLGLAAVDERCFVTFINNGPLLNFTDIISLSVLCYMTGHALLWGKKFRSNSFATGDCFFFAEPPVVLIPAVSNAILHWNDMLQTLHPHSLWVCVLGHPEYLQGSPTVPHLFMPLPL